MGKLFSDKMKIWASDSEVYIWQFFHAQSALFCVMHCLTQGKIALKNSEKHCVILPTLPWDKNIALHSLDFSDKNIINK
jgi:hypothetical protein